MGSLSNLYVSQSYQSLLHLGTDSSFFPVGASPVQGYVTVQDGLGYNAGFAISSSGAMFFSQSIIVDKNLSVNQNLDVDGNLIISGTFDIEGKVTVNDNVRINGNLEVSGATTLTGSLAISNAITASNMFITNDLIVSGTLFANKVVTLIESSSIIFSSGSNILGDSILDTQTLNGTIIMSGSSSLTGSMGITGNLNVLGNGNFGGTGSFIGDLTATGNISSSTISGIGNVTTFSQSVDSRLDFLEGPFSTSVDLRLDQLEAFSSSLQADFATQTELTQTASFLQNQINQKLNTSSFNAYTQSYSASVAVTTTDITNRINTLASFTGSYATTGSNNFRGNQTITGSLASSGSFNLVGTSNFNGNMIYTGSVRGQVVSLSISSTTASMDLSLGNFFTITLNTAGAVRIEPTNIQPGETITLRLTQPAGGYSSVVFPTNVDYPSGYQYTATPAANAVDVITFVTFDTSSLYYSRANQFV
jgi:cytoskeletal protein CcmA (bactofilin family)